MAHSQKVIRSHIDSTSSNFILNSTLQSKLQVFAVSLPLHGRNVIVTVTKQPQQVVPLPCPQINTNTNLFHLNICILWLKRGITKAASQFIICLAFESSRILLISDFSTQKSKIGRNGHACTQICHYSQTKSPRLTSCLP